MFKLDSSNVQAWEPDAADIAKTLSQAVVHVRAERSESDLLYELLLKNGVDLCVPIERRSVDGKNVSSIGGGVLLACLVEKISSQEVESLAAGMIAWHRQLSPVGESVVVLRDSAFSDDIAKANLTAIFAQHGLGNIRSI